MVGVATRKASHASSLVKDFKSRRRDDNDKEVRSMATSLAYADEIKWSILVFGCPVYVSCEGFQRPAAVRVGLFVTAGVPSRPRHVHGLARQSCPEFSRQADYAWTVLAAVLAWAKERQSKSVREGARRHVNVTIPVVRPVARPSAPLPCDAERRDWIARRLYQCVLQEWFLSCL
jgi:hypothetical protein